MNRRSLNWILFALIALAALILRTYAIDHLPPGLFGDEAVEGLDALDVLAGNLAVWFHAHLGREPMYVYLVALAYAAFGVSALATRLPAPTLPVKVTALMRGSAMTDSTRSAPMSSA